MSDTVQQKPESNLAVQAAIDRARRDVLGAAATTEAGAGKAYQMVAQACALAVQDGVDALRGHQTLATAASAAALARFMETGDPRYAEALKSAQGLMTAATDAFNRTTDAAIRTLKAFPGG